MTEKLGESLSVAAAPVDELRMHRERRIKPAGMSYERALEIAIAVAERQLSRADWFAADQVYKAPKLF